MNLTTEVGDYLLTERSDYILADYFEQCDWPTLEEVKLELGIVGSDDDDFLQRQIDTTVESIESYCGRKIPLQVDHQEFSVTLCDTVFGYKSSLQVQRWPIHTVINCYDKDTGQTIDYTIDEYGLLCGNFNLNSRVVVDYHGGIGCPLPGSLLNVFYQIITVRYNAKGSVGVSGEIKSESIPGVIKIDYYQDSSNVSGSSSDADPANYRTVLDFYKTYYV